MNVGNWVSLLTVIAAFVTAAGALYKNRLDARKVPASIAKAETNDALAAMGKLNDMLERRNETLESRVDQLERMVRKLTDRVYELETELEGYRRGSH